MRNPPFDQRVGYHQESLSPTLYRIRTTSDRIAGESWSEYYDRTHDLALGSQARYRRSRRRRIGPHTERHSPHDQT
jgi:hypothetical protein